jgi:hypothetical protein
MEYYAIFFIILFTSKQGRFLFGHKSVGLSRGRCSPPTHLHVIPNLGTIDMSHHTSAQIHATNPAFASQPFYLIATMESIWLYHRCEEIFRSHVVLFLISVRIATDNRHMRKVS